MAVTTTVLTTKRDIDITSQMPQDTQPAGRIQTHSSSNKQG